MGTSGSWVSSSRHSTNVARTRRPQFHCQRVLYSAMCLSEPMPVLIPSLFSAVSELSLGVIAARVPLQRRVLQAMRSENITHKTARPERHAHAIFLICPKYPSIKVSSEYRRVMLVTTCLDRASGTESRSRASPADHESRFPAQPKPNLCT